jgi:hypothetical protein
LICVNELKEVVKLSICHVKLFWLSVFPVVETINFFEDFKDLLSIKLPSFLVIILSEQSDKVSVPSIFEVVKTFISLLLVARVEYGQEKIHEYEQTQCKVDDKECTLPTVLTICWQHHIREVRGCQ